MSNETFVWFEPVGRNKTSVLSELARIVIDPSFATSHYCYF